MQRRRHSSVLVDERVRAAVGELGRRVDAGELGGAGERLADALRARALLSVGGV
jgi:hypothetical protein